MYFLEPEAVVEINLFCWLSSAAVESYFGKIFNKQKEIHIRKFSLLTCPVFEISSFKGTRLIRFITPQTPPSLGLPQDGSKTRFRNVVILAF
jgi:hypothetical protein